MGAFGNLETHEITLPIEYSGAFSLVRRTAESCGIITDENELLGLIKYKTKMSFTAFKNPATVEINVVNQGNNTLLRVSVNSNDGMGLFRTSSRTYDAFITELSAQSRT